jgi:nitrogenase molybdenum-iron protein NifN
MLSPADLRHLKEITDDFGLSCMMLPDYSKTLDGSLWSAYERIPAGGTPVEEIRNAGGALASIEFGSTLAKEKETAGKWMEKNFKVPIHSIGIPIGVGQTDAFFRILETVSGNPVPHKYIGERGRLIDALVDGHKIVNGIRAVVYGEEDWIIGLVSWLSEIGVIPVLCASGGRSGRLAEQIHRILPEKLQDVVQTMEDADFIDMEAAANNLKPDLLIGNSKGYSMARRLKVPLVRLGFPIHDRMGGPRLIHIGYRGAQQIFDQIANAVIEKRQEASPIGYTYM